MGKQFKHLTDDEILKGEKKTRYLRKKDRKGSYSDSGKKQFRSSSGVRKKGNWLNDLLKAQGVDIEGHFKEVKKVRQDHLVKKYEKERDEKRKKRDAEIDKAADKKRYK